jgi:signal transduction histidine kinase
MPIFNLKHPAGIYSGIYRVFILLLCWLIFIPRSYCQEGVINISSFDKSRIMAEQDSTVVRNLFTIAEGLQQANMDSALVILQRAYQLSTKNNMAFEKTKALSLMAVCYIRKGEYDKSNNLIAKAFKGAESLDNPNLLAFLHNAEAISAQQNGAYATGALHYLKALNILQQYNLDTTARAIQTYINFGGLWITMNEKKQALKYLLKAKEHARLKYKDPYLLMNIGIAYTDSSNEDAIHYFNDALDIATKSNDIYIQHKLYINLCTIYTIEKKFDLAMFYMNKAEQVTEILGTDIARAINSYHKGDLYWEMKDYTRAEGCFLTGLSLAERTGLKGVAKDIHLSLGRLYGLTGKYPRAYYHQQRFISIMDSLDHLEKDKSVDLLLNYHAAEKDKIIARKQLQITIKENALKGKNTWIMIMCGSTVLLVLILTLAHRNYRNRQKLQEEQLQGIARQQEIGRLKAIAEGEEMERNRIAHELHDSVMIQFAAVKMKLNALSSSFPELSGAADYSQALRQLNVATSELRRTAHNLMPDVLLEEGLAQAIYYFCKTVEEHASLSVVFQQVGEPIPALRQDFEIAVYRIVQELIQNVVKHADARKVIVQLMYSNGLFSVTVEDDGKGYDAGAVAEGLGLRSIRNSIRAFNGILDLKSIRQKGTTAYLECEVTLLTLSKQL